jgi:hypothetical protein
MLKHKGDSTLDLYFKEMRGGLGQLIMMVLSKNAQICEQKEATASFSVSNEE